MSKTLQRLTLSIAGLSLGLSAWAETIVPTGDTYTTNITIPDGETTTFDLSGYTGASPFRLEAGVYSQGSGKFVVKGANRLAIGKADARDKDGKELHFPLVSADISFEEADGKLVLVDFVTLERATCEYEIADGAHLALWGTDPLNNGTSDFRVENYDVVLLNETALDPNVTITVANGRYLRVRPCQHNASNPFNWASVSKTIANNVVLEEGSVLRLCGYNQLTLSGDISGKGTLTLQEGQVATHFVKLTGELTFDGTVNVDGCHLIVDGATSVGAATNEVVLRGWEPSVTLMAETAQIGKVTGAISDTPKTAWVDVLANKTLTIGTLAGSVELRGRDVTTSKVIVNAIDEGAALEIDKAHTAAAGALLSLPSEDTLETLKLIGGATVILESGRIASVVGEGHLVVRGDAALGLIAKDVSVVVEPKVHVTSVAVTPDAQTVLNMSALWLDASAAETLQEYSYNGHTVSKDVIAGQVIRRWNDCRADQSEVYALNARCSLGSSDGGYIRTMPYTLLNELNGLPVVTFGAYNGQVKGALNQIDANGTPDGGGARAEQRRLVLNKPVEPTLIVMVFGSQDGGGKAYFGGYNDTSYGEAKNLQGDENFTRSTQTTAFGRPGQTLDQKVLSTLRPFWMDGVAIDPTNEENKLSGGYQILSMAKKDGETVSIRSLGMSQKYDDAGGQRYAEIVVFTNAVSDVQRVTVERYLAKKWGLQATYQDTLVSSPSSVTLGEGATFETDGSSVLPVSGSGSVMVKGDATASGAFAGLVTVTEGATLTIPLGKRIWTDADVAKVSGRIGWFDPECAESLVMGADPQPNRIHAIYDRIAGDTADTAYLHGYYRDANNDRRPLLINGSRAEGPIRNWVDLMTEDAGYTKKGNNFRIKTDHSKAKGDDSSNTTLEVKTAFIVQDSVNGGGSPIIDKNTPGSSDAVVGVRTYTNPASPIWGSGTGAILTKGETRLNGVTVDGTKTGFTGAPELFSFTTDGSAALNAGFFGFYNAGKEGAYEVLGEILLFNEVLTGETRDAIEAYLMKKWLGRTPAGKGYDDWTKATITGPGTVAVDATTLAFRLDGVSTSVENAIAVEGVLKLPEVGVIDLAFADGKVMNGTYTLATFGSLVGADWTKWTLPKTINGRKCRISVSEHALTATITNGFVLSIR